MGEQAEMLEYHANILRIAWITTCEEVARYVLDQYTRREVI